MTPVRKSLSRSLTRPLLLAFSVASVVCLFISVHIVQSEYDELLDLSLSAKGNLLLPLVLADHTSGNSAVSDPLARIEGPSLDDDEKGVFWLLDAAGRVLRHTEFMPPDLDRPQISEPGFWTVGEFRYFVTPPDPNGNRLKIGEHLTERNESFLGTLLGISFSLVTLVIIAFVIMRRAIKQVQSSVVRLSTEIGDKSETNLTPIDPATAFEELTPAIETLNALMARLDKAILSERSFATNAAHELRTPLAVSLAHIQRLRAATDDPDISQRATVVEAGLKRLIHLIERLLQLSRVQSGLGKLDRKSDVNQVVDLVLQEAAQRRDQSTSVSIFPPTGTFASSIDPDALAILLTNLVDNAVKYSRGPDPVRIDSREPGRVTITNDCDPLSGQDLAAIKNRFVRKSSGLDGYGVGLAIANTICDQSGAEMTISSPAPGSERGFAVTVLLPD